MSDAARADKVAKSLQSCQSISAMRDVLRAAGVNLDLIQHGGDSLRRSDPEGAAAWDHASQVFWALSKQLPESAGAKAGAAAGLAGSVDHGKLTFGR